MPSEVAGFGTLPDPPELPDHDHEPAVREWWGDTVEDARRHVEILEFLLECIARRRMLARSIGVVEFPNTPRAV